MTNVYDFPAGAPSGPMPSAPAPQKGGRWTIADLPGHKNIAELLPEDRLVTIGTDVWDEYDIDEKSRADKVKIWDATSKAFSLAPEPKNTPFPNAANVKFPILTTACMQFAARAMPAIIHDGKIAKGKVIGKEREPPPPPVPDMGTSPDMGMGFMPPDMGGMSPPPEPGMPAAMPPPMMGGDSSPPSPPMPSGPDMPPPVGGPGMGGPTPAPEAPPFETKADQADRIAGYLNYQLLDKDTAWVTEMDQAMHQFPAYGTVFKKVYRDPIFGNRSELVSCRDLVINASYPSLERAPRFTQRFDLYPNQIKERQIDGRFLPGELINTPQPAKEGEKRDETAVDPSLDKSAAHEFLEQHRLIDLDEDGYQEPYCVTLHVPSKKVVRITASYGTKDIVLKDDGSQTVARIKPYRYFVDYIFIPDIEGGPYGMGFGELLMHPVEVINSVINQMLDSGNLSTAGGGFIGKEFRLPKGATSISISPGKFMQTTFASDDIRKSIIPLEFQQPSPVLFQLLGFLVEQVEKIVSSPEVLSGEAPPNQPATTTLALIEQGLKVFTGIIGRVLRALGQELKVLYDLNARYIPEDEAEYFNYGDDEQFVMGKDFDPAAADVVPVADASQSTDMQKMAKAEAIVNTLGHPVLGPLINPMEAAKRYFEAMGISSQELLAEQPPQPPPDPQMEKVALDNKKFDEVEKPMAELDAGKKHIELLVATMSLPPELQKLLGIENPIQIANPAEQQDMAHKDEAHGMAMSQAEDGHGMDMAGKAQKMDHAEQGMELKTQAAEQPDAQ